jgi:hypothetical protein
MKPAFLPSHGLNDRRATLHTFVRSEVITLHNETGPITGVAHFFRCSETGEERRWGFDAVYFWSKDRHNATSH